MNTGIILFFFAFIVFLIHSQIFNELVIYKSLNLSDLMRNLLLSLEYALLESLKFF